MTTADIVDMVGYLVSVWSAGFCGGYLITKFRHAVNLIV